MTSHTHVVRSRCADSAWAIARLAQCKQFKIQLHLVLPVPPALDEGPDALHPLVLHAIVWWDEHHKKVRLGHASKFECLVSRDDAGKVCSPEDGGKFPERKPTTTAKYLDEARGSFGAAMRKKADGEMEGVKCKPFNYTGQWIYGPKTFADKRKAELARVKPMPRKFGGIGRGYEDVYPDTYLEEVDKVLAKGNNACICVTKARSHGARVGGHCDTSDVVSRLSRATPQMMDHIVAESKKVYEGTEWEDTFLIFHDGLSAWWEPEAQEHLKTLGFQHRQLRCVGDTNKANPYYYHKVVGDSPEMCRALDSHGFADLEDAITYNCALSTRYNLDDPRRFKMGTPSEVWSTIERCWTVAPTSARIVQDISKFEAVLDKIIEKEGAVCPDLFLRTGRRARQALRGNAQLKHTPRDRQTTATLCEKPRHPDNDEAYRLLIS